MKRKINRVGQNTLTVSLPAKWAKKHNLKAGDEIDVDEENNYLLIGEAGKREIEEKISIEIKENLPIYIRSVIGSYYIEGISEIKIKYKDPGVYRSIKDAANSLMGYEIIEHGDNYCIIKSMINSLGAEFAPTLRKMISVIRTMREIFLDDLKKDDFKNSEEIQDLRYTNWKFRDYCLRMINKNDLFGRNNIYYSSTIIYLEKVSNNYKNMYEYCFRKEHLKRKLNQEVLDLLNEVDYHFDVFVEGIMKKNNYLIDEETRIKRIKLLKKLEDALYKNKFDNGVLAYLLLGIKIVNMLNSPLITIHLELGK